MATATTVSPITTHVLDTSRGKPAEGIKVKLQRHAGSSGAATGAQDANAQDAPDAPDAPDSWQDMAQGATDKDGRVGNLLAPGSLETGMYRLSFDTRAYFQSQGTQTFFPHVTIVFEIVETAQHYHVPLLLSPFGYSTYRGS